MKQVGRFGLWVPEDTDAPDSPTQLTQLIEGTEATEGLDDLLALAGAQARKVNIAGTQSRENTSYGVLGTADEVKEIILPAYGLIFVHYEALVKNTVASAGRVAIFLNENQLKIPRATTAPVTQAAACSSSTSTFEYLSTFERGLYCGTEGAPTTPFEAVPLVAGVQLGTEKLRHEINGGIEEFDVGNGEAGKIVHHFMGGICVIRAPAGTYTVSIRYKASSGKIESKERTLRVWTQGFN